MSLALQTILTMPSSHPLSQIGETVFGAIETNDIQWMKTNKEKLSTALHETFQHNREEHVTPLQYAAINGNIRAFKILFGISGPQDEIHLLKLFMRHKTEDTEQD